MQLFAGQVELLDEGRRRQGSLALAEARPLYGVEPPRPKLVIQTRSPDVVRDGLRARLVDDAGCTLAEGKDGFAPPF